MRILKYIIYYNIIKEKRLDKELERERERERERVIEREKRLSGPWIFSSVNCIFFAHDLITESDYNYAYTYYT